MNRWDLVDGFDEANKICSRSGGRGGAGGGYPRYRTSKSSLTAGLSIPTTPHAHFSGRDHVKLHVLYQAVVPRGTSISAPHACIMPLLPTQKVDDGTCVIEIGGMTRLCTRGGAWSV